MSLILSGTDGLSDVDGTAATPAIRGTDTYKFQRAAEYPSIADQLDKIFHDGIDEWKETIQAVKDKYPKS